MKQIAWDLVRLVNVFSDAYSKIFFGKQLKLFNFYVVLLVQSLL